MITERDVEALKHLVDVHLEYLTEGENKESKTMGKPGFKIIFEFTKNDFFDNEILEKTYLYQEENGEYDDDELEDLFEGKLEEDYQIGEDLKEKVIPCAIDCFTRKALQYDIMKEEDDFEDDEDLDDDEHSNDDDDSNSNVDIPTRKRGGNAKGRGGAPGAEVNPEDCKNQLHIRNPSPPTLKHQFSAKLTSVL